MLSDYLGVLALEDGTVFRGIPFGYRKTVLGELVFNTSMSGYQEILTDPSYYGQIITMTCPQIGNYGINKEDQESLFPHAFGFVIRDLSPYASNWRSELSLNDYLIQHHIPGIHGIDTRAITKKIRIAGSLKACLSTENISHADAVQRAQESSSIIGGDYAQYVTCKTPYLFPHSIQDCTPFTVDGTHLYPSLGNRKIYSVVAFDFGAKRSIFIKLRHHGFEVTVVPASTPFEKVREMNPDGVFLSNGPGDPSALTYAHQAIRRIIEHYPTFGICMGHQIITHALGANTFKLKFGHRGGNQPVKNLETGKVSITSQNHGFASTAKEIENRGAIVTEVNLNDETVEGLRHKDLPVFSVQYHPEASPGPHDSEPLFEQFYQLVHTYSA